MSTALIRTYREWALWRRSASLRSVLAASIPALVAVGLFKLAVSEGGRDPQSLAIVQTALLLVTAIGVWWGLTKRVAVTGSLLGVTAAVAMTSLVSVRPDSSLREILLWMTYCGVFVLVASTLRTKEAARRFLDALVVIAGWVALVGFRLFWGSNNPGMRWYSTFYWPNPFAAFLLLVIPLGLSRLVRARGARETLVHGAMTLLLTVPFVLTYSRGAWLALIAVMPLGFFLFRPASRLVALARLAITAVILIGLVVLLTRGGALQSSPQAVLGRAVSVANANDNSIQGRLNFWQSGLAIFRDYPLLGTGPGTFAYVNARYQRNVRYYAKDAHSLYVQTAAEMGLLGLVTLGALLLSIGALCLRTLRRMRDSEEYPLVAGVTVGLAAFFVHSALDMNWPFPVNPAMAFALVGVLAFYDRVAPAEAAPTAPARSVSRVWLSPVLALLAVAVLVVHLVQAEQERFQAGRRFASARRWSDVAASLSGAARLNPLDPRVPSGLALASEHLGADSIQVTALIRRSMALDKLNAYYPVQLADYLHRQAGSDLAGRSKAIALLRQALVLDPYHYPDAYQMLARIYAEADQPRQAEAVYREARARYGRGLTQDGILYMMLWPGVAGLYMDWAHFLIGEGRLADAGAVYWDILAEDRRYVPAYLAGADLMLRQHRMKDALDLLRRGLESVPANEILWQRWRKLSVGRLSIWEQ